MLIQPLLSSFMTLLLPHSAALSSFLRPHLILDLFLLSHPSILYPNLFAISSTSLVQAPRAPLFSGLQLSQLLTRPPFVFVQLQFWLLLPRIFALKLDFAAFQPLINFIGLRGWLSPH